MSNILPPHPVHVHSYLPSSSNSSGSEQAPRAVQTYEHLPSNFPANTSSRPENALVFIGGLGDGPNTIPYVRHLAEHLFSLSSSSSSSSFATPAGPDGGYAVFEARLSSAFTGFGYASLAQDAREIADLVRYLRKGLGVKRVVLMGHSTGCQDCLEYGSKFLHDLSGEGGESEEVRVDGLVLQGPVSDREAIGMVEDKEEVEGSLRVAEGMVKEGRGGEVVSREVLPKGWRGSPVTAERWCSLAGFGGDDDYFSSDLPDDRVAEIWGRLEQPVLILPSEKDEWVPEHVDVARLVDKWKSFCKPGIASDLGGLIPGANHRVDNEDGQQWLADRVARFLSEVEKWE